MEEGQSTKRMKLDATDNMDVDMEGLKSAGSSSSGIFYLFFEPGGDPSHDIYAFEIDTLSGSMRFLVKLLTPLARHMGYVAVGSKVYIVGGEFVRLPWTDATDYGLFPLNTEFVDRLDKEPKLQPGPSLLGPKPWPMVATLNGQIYVLSGVACHTPQQCPVKPIFELLEPKSSSSKILPDPPFTGSYGPDHRNLFIKAHTVIEDTIFVKLSIADYVNGNHRRNVYAYNVLEAKWSSSNNNETAYILEHEFPEWDCWAAVVGGVAYRFCYEECQVLAKKLTVGSSWVIVEGLKAFIDRVTCRKHIRGKPLALLASFRDGSLCVVLLYKNDKLPDKRGIVVLKFKVITPYRYGQGGENSQLSVQAIGVQHWKYYIDDRFCVPNGWCEM